MHNEGTLECTVILKYLSTWHRFTNSTNYSNDIFAV